MMGRSRRANVSPGLIGPIGTLLDHPRTSVQVEVTSDTCRFHDVMRAVWTLVGVLWFGGVVAGFAVLARWDNTAGVAAAAPTSWPAGSHLTRDEQRPTLVMLAHPRCSCTRASLAELSELMARAEQRPRAYVVFIKPQGVAAEWEKTDLWQTAARIPDVTVVRDLHGLETHRFGAETSGQTMLYATDGRLLFSGGTTGSRGHEGDNQGRESLLALLSHRDPHQSNTPVFGCPLYGDAERPTGGAE